MSGEPIAKKVKDPRVETSAERLARIADARQLFLSSTINMSWQLAVTIIVPLLIGVSLDNKYNSSPSYTLGALFIAVTLACWVVAKTIKSVKLTQSDTKADTNKKGSTNAK